MTQIGWDGCYQNDGTKSIVTVHTPDGDKVIAIPNVDISLEPQQ